jgi:hypothetical protein
MKRLTFGLLVLVLGLAVSPAFGQVTQFGGFGNVGQTGTGDVSASSANKNTVTTAVTGVTFSTTPMQNLPNTPFFPLPVPLIQGGRVGDITDQLPNFGGMKKLRLPYIKENGERKEVDPGETVNPDKIESFQGWLLSRICLEDVWKDVVKYYRKMQESGWDPAKMRYRVYYKDKAKGVGINVGGSFGGSGQNSATAPVNYQGSGGGIFGYASSYADPMYIVMICEVMD